ncbi:protein kinase activity protein [[Candida] boidinii]|nr:protein kinase activity protein [[Candida] boidinii]
MVNTPKIDSETIYASRCKKDLYEIHRTLGTGSFGAVHHAIRKDSRKHYAMKIILKSTLKNQRKIVEDEILFLATLKHPNIVKFKDWFEDFYQFYIVTGLAKGGELFERLVKRNIYTEVNAAAIISQLLSAVKYLHKHNVAHRDIKLENILYLNESEDSPIVLADFGIAKKLASKDETLTGVAGSFGYIAPEIYAGEGYGDLYGIGSGGYTKSCDIWSIGVVAYTLIGGQPPIRSESPQDFLQEVKTNNFILFDPQYWQHISPEAKAFILSCMDIDNIRRPETDQLLDSPWIKKFFANGEDPIRSSTIIDETAPNLISGIRQGFDAAKKFKGIVDIIMVQNQLKKLRETIEQEKLADGIDNTDGDDDYFIFHKAGSSAVDLPNLKDLSLDVNSNKSLSSPSLDVPLITATATPSAARRESLKSTFHTLVKAASTNQDKILEYRKGE